MTAYPAANAIRGGEIGELRARLYQRDPASARERLAEARARLQQANATWQTAFDADDLGRVDFASLAAATAQITVIEARLPALRQAASAEEEDRSRLEVRLAGLVAEYEKCVQVLSTDRPERGFSVFHPGHGHTPPRRGLTEEERAEIEQDLRRLAGDAAIPR